MTVSTGAIIVSVTQRFVLSLLVVVVVVYLFMCLGVSYTEPRLLISGQRSEVKTCKH